MAGQINNYELIKLVCCYKMPVLLAMRFVEAEWLGYWTYSLVILGSGSLWLFTMFVSICLHWPQEGPSGDWSNNDIIISISIIIIIIIEISRW